MSAIKWPKATSNGKASGTLAVGSFATAGGGGTTCALRNGGITMIAINKATPKQNIVRLFIGNPAES